VRRPGLTLPGVLTAVLNEKRVQGSMMGSSAFQQDLPRFARMYLDGLLLLDELVSKRLPLAQINEGFEAMLGGEIARSVVAIDEVLRESARAA
jgi:S-(hydroxymethyl)glutathione dehydrogenase/alcohol dehydrogenase